MITKFKEPIKTKETDIDELYDGKYVAYLQPADMFDECYIVAVGAKTKEVYSELRKYLHTRLDKEEKYLYCGIHVGNKNKEDEELYVIFREVR